MSSGSDGSGTAIARQAFDLPSEVRYTLRLGIPLALGELGWMSTYIVDALMIGHLANSALAISASSLGNSIFYAIAFFAIYLMNGLETLIAQAYGQQHQDNCVRLLAQSIWFVVLGTPVVLGFTLGALALLPYFGTPANIVAQTKIYVHPLLWSTVPLLAYMVLRRFLQSVDSVLWVTISLLTASLVNWLGDYTFLFGHFGFKPTGIAGSAWATVIVRFYMLGLLVVGTAVTLRRFRQPLTWAMLRPDRHALGALLRIGWPSGLEMFTELGTSTFTSVLCARLGAVMLAAHQVLLDLNALVYQVPTGLAYATIVRVGQSAGRDNVRQVRLAANASLLLGIGFMAVAASIFAGFSHHWASLYTNSVAVVAGAVPIFKIAAIMLVTDTTFVLLASALTGLGDTRTPMIVSIVWNWAIGMPISYLLATHSHFGLYGVWAGRVVASAGMALTLLTLWRSHVAKAERSRHVSSLRILGSPAAVGGD